MPVRPPLALTYHAVGDRSIRDDEHGLWVRPGHLRAHIAALRGWGYQLVRFSELAAAVAQGGGRNLAALTFDDGFENNLTELVPVLADLAAPATVFVVSGLLGQPHPDAPEARLVTADELRELATAVEIGGHSSTHRDLTTLAFEEVRDDLLANRTELEDLIGRPVSVFAYPFGRAHDETARACREAGFRAAGRTGGTGDWSDPWNLPRQDMNNDSTVLGLRLKRDDRYRELMRLPPARALRKVGRLARARWR